MLAGDLGAAGNRKAVFDVVVRNNVNTIAAPKGKGAIGSAADAQVQNR